MLGVTRWFSTLSLAVVMGLSVSAAWAADNEADYNFLITSKKGDAVTDSYKECWKVLPNGKQPSDEVMAECVGVDKCKEDADGDGVPGDGIEGCPDLCPGTPPGVQVDANGCQIITEIILHDVNFAFDRYNLSAHSRQILDDAASQLRNNPNVKHITIIGHTDSIGTEAYNQRLSVRRADAVMNYLAAQGVPTDLMSAEGRGELEPIASNRTARGRAENRRVHIKVDNGGAY